MVKVKGRESECVLCYIWSFNHPMVKVKDYCGYNEACDNTSFNHPMVKVKEDLKEIIL